VGQQESRTLDTEWRVSAGRVQKGNNGSRRPYIRPQSAGSWISGSRGVEPSRSLKIPKWTVSQPSNLRGSHTKASRRKQRRGKHTRSKIATSRHSGLGHQESPNWGTSGWGPEGITRLSQGVCFPTLSRPHPGESPNGSVRVKRKRPTTKNRELGKESCLRPREPCPTKQDLAWRTSGGSICGFKRRWPGEPCSYRRSSRTATAQIPECQNTKLLVRKGVALDRGHRLWRQQTSLAATLPSPSGAHWGTQERRGRQTLGWSRVESSSALGVKNVNCSFLVLPLTLSAIWART